MHTKFKKYLSFVLVFAMLFGNLSTINVFASDAGAQNYILHITGVSVFKVGDKQAMKDQFTISLNYSGKVKLSDVMQGVSKVIVNGEEVALRENNLPTFLLQGDSYCAWEVTSSPAGTKLVRDFKERGEENTRVEIRFENGSMIEFQGDNYVAPENPGQGGDQDPGEGDNQNPDQGDSPKPGQDEQTEEEQDDPKMMDVGMAKEVTPITDVAVDKYDEYVNITFSKNSKSEDVKKISYVLINGDKYENIRTKDGDNITVNFMDDNVRIANFDAKVSYKKKSPVKVKVVYKDGSYTKFEKQVLVEELPYQVEFYQEDTKLEVKLDGVVKSNAPEVKFSDLEDAIKKNAPEGYEFDKVLSSTFPFKVTKENKLIEIKYKKKILDLPYTIEFYKDGKKLERDLKKSVKSNKPVVAQADIDADIKRNLPDGYKVDVEKSTKLPFTVSKTENVIKIMFVKMDPPSQGQGIAKDYMITEVVAKKKSYGNGEVVWILFKSKQNPNSEEFTDGVESGFSQKVKKVTINGDVYVKRDKNSTEITDSYDAGMNKQLMVDLEKAIASFKKKKNVEVEVEYTDGTKSTFGKEPTEEEKIDFDKLTDGTYTLSYKVYVHGSNQSKESSIAHYFDKKAKLVVDGDKKTVSFLNHKFASLILDFALEKNGEFHQMQANVMEMNKERREKVEYSIDFATLNGLKTLAVLGSGPMMGSESMIGDYKNPNYRKIELQFDGFEKEFTEYEIIQKEREIVENNAKNLYTALDSNNVDKNGDGTITADELYEAKGKPTIVFQGESPKPNMLDLRRAGLVDISSLKDLGPHVKGILLDDGNDLRELPAGVFDKAVNLEYILLSGNKNLSALPKGIFDQNKKLKVFTADGCNLGALPEGIFKHNSELQTIGMMNAGITSVPGDMIRNAPNLEELFLQENSIKTLPDDFFEGQRESISLKDISLAHNELDALPSSIGYVTGVDRIFADNNKITSVPATLVNLDIMTNLDLENNLIQSVPTELLTDLIKKAKNNPGGVRLDLSNNRIKTLPIAEMLEALKDGSALTKFEIDKNYLKSNLTEEEIKDLTRLGVDFKGAYVYLPQKTLFEGKGLAQGGTIELKQRFDILELYYWTLGDSHVDLGKRHFGSAREFEEYLTKNGRYVNHVSEDLERDEAITQILENKKTAWKVETVIKKNGKQEIFKKLSSNEKEGLVQRFEDKEMKKGDKYTLTKTLFTNYGLGYRNQMEYSVDFIATKGVNEESKAVEIPVAALMHGTDKESMMKQYLKPTALYQKKDGKHVYTIFLKQVQRIDLFGRTVYAVDQVGEFDKAFTFELAERHPKMTVTLYAEAMPAPQKADLAFDYSGVVDQDTDTQPKAKEIPVKAYRFGTQEPSKVAEALKPTALYEEKNGKHSYILSFRPIQVGDKKASVDTIEVNGVTIQPKVADGEYNKTFTFILDQRKEKITIKTGVSAMNHSYPVDLVFDYSGLSGGNGNGNQGQNPGNPGAPDNGGNQGNQPQAPADEYNLENGVQYRVNVSLLNYHSNEISMGDKAFENNRSAYITRMGNRYKIEITSNPIQMGEAQAGIERLVSHDDAIASIQHETTNLGNLTYASKITIYANRLKDTYDVGIYAGPMNDTKAKLKFDLANRQKSNDVVDANTGTVPGASSAPKDDKKDRKKEEIKDNKVPLSEKKEQVMDEAKVKELVKDFTDVTESAWYREAVAFVLDKKLFNGTSKTSFEPNKSMTRGMVVTVLHRLADKKESKETALADVARNMYYAKAFDWAVSEGMIKGYADSTYKPENTITRQEFVSILYRYAKAAAGKEASLDKFTDKSEVAAWAKEAIAWAVEMGIIEGDNANLNPNKELTRAEAASILKRFITSQEQK